jgi:periplasmic copper chaperone A
MRQGRVTSHTTRRCLVALGVAVACWAGAAVPAWAHVGITGAATVEEVTTVDFAWDHGCGSQPTIALELRLPDGATVVASRLMPGWSATTEGSVMRLTGPEVPDGTPAMFALELTGHDTSVEHLVPTLQICPDGQEAWIDADPTASNSAPRMAATTEEPPATTTTADTTPPEEDAAVVTATEDEATNATDAATDTGAPWAIIALAVVAGVVVAVVVAVGRARRTSTTD